MKLYTILLTLIVASAAAQNCTLCPDGSPPPIPYLVLPNRATCGNVDALAREETTENGCAVLRNYAAAACGCEGQVVSPIDTCTTLCLDGSQVTDPGAIVGKTISGKTVTCGEVQAQVALGVQDQETCNTYALMGVYRCGCNNTLAEPQCQICENGSVPPNLLHDVDGNGNICVEFMTSMMNVNDTSECMAFQATVGVYCGCDNRVASEDACRICGKGQLLPNPSRIAEANSEITCREAEYAANLEGSSSFCSDMQGNFATTCCGPDQANPTDDNNDDLLPQLDDGRVDATSPPENVDVTSPPSFQQENPTAMEDNSSAPGSLTALPFKAFMIVAFYLI